MSRAPSALCLVLGALLCCGCGKVRQISACRAVAREVNGAVDEIEALAKKKPMDEAHIARRYGDLARSLEPRGNGVTTLAAAIKDYVAVVRSTETTLKARVEASKVPYAKVGESTRELDRLVKREHAAIARIEAECSTR